MSDKLEPCPFCGGKPVLTTNIHGIEYYRVWCVACGFKGHGINLKKWNTRPAEDAKDKRIAELEAHVERLRTALHGAIHKGEGDPDLDATYLRVQERFRALEETPTQSLAAIEADAIESVASYWARSIPICLDSTQKAINNLQATADCVRRGRLTVDQLRKEGE